MALKSGRSRKIPWGMCVIHARETPHGMARFAREMAARPDDLVLGAVWAFTYTGGPSGLEVSEVELIPPERKVHEEK